MPRKRFYGKPRPAQRDVKAALEFLGYITFDLENEKMKELSFSELRTVNTDRVSYFGHGNLDNGWNVAEWGCALAGETGELCNLLKKVIRQADFDPSVNELLPEIADEIGDVLCYLDLLAAKLGLKLDDCVTVKFNRVSEKYGFPQRIRME